MKVITKAYTYKGQTFAIVKNNDGVICAINHKYIDESGKLIQRLNGIQMHCSPEDNTVDGIMQRIRTDIDFSDYIAAKAAENGMAAKQLTEDIPLYTKLCAKFFGIPTKQH